MKPMSVGKTAYIAVVGLAGSERKTDALAFEAGRLIGARGAVMLCGGLGGVMNAAAEGAKEAGGTTIGILPGNDRAGASRFLDYAIPTGLGHARNAIIALAADGMVAIGEGYGTLSEIALVLKDGKPVVGLSSWNLAREGRSNPVFPVFSNPLEAVEAVFSLIERPR